MSDEPDRKGRMSRKGGTPEGPVWEKMGCRKKEIWESENGKIVHHAGLMVPCGSAVNAGRDECKCGCECGINGGLFSTTQGLGV